MHSECTPDEGLKYPKYNKGTKKSKNRKKERKNIPEKIKILYTNANGIKGKASSLETILIQEEIHIATVAETKLQGPPPRIEGYSWFTKNRKNSPGGGVAILARNDIISKVRTIDKVEDKGIEILWITLQTDAGHDNLAVGYIMAPKKMKM